MTRTPVALKAGAAYFAVVFAAGFGLGVIRTLFVIPRVGETAAVLIEAPVMLAISWLVARRLVRAFAVPDPAGARLLMGAVALVLTLAAEAGLSVLLFGRTLDQHFESYLTGAGALGLIAQIGFAVIPWLQRSQPD